MKRSTFVALAVVLLTGCSGGNPFSSAPSPPDLPSSVMDIDECQPVTRLPCVDQSIQVKVPVGRTGLDLFYRSDRVPGRTTAPTADIGGQRFGGWTLGVVHSFDPKANLLLLGDGRRRHVAALQIQSGAYAGRLAIASVDGRQVFVFDSSGRHQTTVDAISGVALLRFDRDTAGRVIGVRDRSGSTVGVKRDAKGRLTGFTLPSGALVPVTLGDDGLVAQIQQPGGGSDSFTYTQGGLMTSHTMPGGAAAFFSYDEHGLLTTVTQPGGATQSLTRSITGGGYSIVVRSSSGRSAVYAVSRSGNTVTRSIEDGGGKSQEVIAADGTRQLTLADGNRVTTQLGPDPRFGMQAPVTLKEAVASPNGLSQVLTEKRQATVGDDPLVGVQLGETIRLDDQPFTTTYDPRSRTVTISDPAGARSTSVLDTLGRVQRSVHAGVLSEYSYDKRSRITAVATGPTGQQRIGRVAYDDSAGVVTVTDPAGKVTEITADAAGRLSLLTLPGSARASLLYDAAGRLVDLQAPGGGNHVLTYSERGLLTSEWSPLARGGAFGTSLGYDDDGLTSRVGSGTSAPVKRDPAGRLTAIRAAGNVVTASFVPGSDVPSQLTGPGGIQLTRTLDGGLVTGETWSGPVSGNVTLTLDGQGRVVATDTGGTQVATPYDSSGRPSRAGNVVLTYDPASGAIAKQAIGSLTTSITYDSFGQMESVVTDSSSGPIFKQAFVHDPDGRIVEVDETLGGINRAEKFAYDADARLVSEGVGGSMRTYEYSADGNIVRVSGPQGNVPFSYDAADRLLRAGSTSFTYAPDGSLATRRGPEGTTRYRYDERGVLISVALPRGRHIDYLTDAIGRRLGKRVNGALVDGMLWAGSLATAQLDASGAVIARFAFDVDGRLIEMLRGDKAYRVLTDPNGSVRLVVDSTDGSIAQRIDYDAYGSVISDSKPGFQPFGFAGGVYDRDTGLVRIGQRDYDAKSRRWTAPDPIGLAGGQLNLYAYVDDDPINFRDPSGRRGALVAPTYGIGVQATGILGTTGGTIGIGLQNVGGHWGIYGNAGQGAGVDFGLSINGNAGNIYSPSSDPSADWSGATNSGGGNIGPFGAGYYQSPNLHNGNGDASYEGFFGDYGVGIPLGGSTTTTTTVCLAGCGSSHGDPHYANADGLAVDYQGAGEYLALTSTNHDIDVQVRQEPRAASLQVSINTAVAANIAGDKVGVYAPDPNLPARPSLVVNGKPNFNLGAIDLPHGGHLAVEAGSVLMTWPDGTYLLVHKVPVANVEYSITASRKGTVSGLWGAYTGDPAKDLVTRTGEIMTPRGNGQVDARFGDSWRITQQESLFDDLPGQDVARYTNRAFGTRPATRDKLSPAARSRGLTICQGAGLSGLPLTNCILDVGATGDPTFAAAEAATTVPRPQVPDQFDIGIGEPVSPNRPAPGAGKLTHAGQKQVYSFYSEASRNIYVSADAPCDGAPAFTLNSPGGGGVIESVGCTQDMGLVHLVEAGQYEIVATIVGNDPSNYSFTVHSAPPDQEFNIKPGDQISPDNPSGAGNISTLGLRQLYTFSISADQVVYLEHGSICNRDMRYALVPRDRVNGTYGQLTLCDDWGRAKLTPGTWTVEVQGGKTTATFTFNLLSIPPDVHFAIAIGTQVSPGHPTPGAGHIDAHGSRHLYDFTGTSGQVIHLSHTGGCGAQGGLQYRLTTPDSLDGDTLYLSLCSDWGNLKLPAGGAYTIEVRAQSDSGDYGFNLELAAP